MTKNQIQKSNEKEQEKSKTAAPAEATSVTKKEAAVNSRNIPVFIEKYNTQGWFKSFLFGIILGIAIVVPGISGAAIAIIFKLYDKLLYAVGNIFKKFKLCFLFLLPIILGAVIGFIAGFFAVQKLLDLIPFGMIMFFAGLMLGAFPSVYQEIKGTKVDGKRIVLLIIGFLIPIAIAGLTLFLSKDATFTYNPNADTSEHGAVATSVFGETYPIWLYFVAFPIGMVLGITQVIPGLSATAFLMMIGYFYGFVDSVHGSYWSSHPEIWIVYVIMGVGMLVGYFLTSKIMNKLFAMNRNLTYHAVVGLSAGSIITMFISTDMFKQVYVVWANAGIKTLDLVLGCILIFVGFAISFGLVIYMRKRDQKEAAAK